MSRQYGVVLGRVEDVADPQGEGRVKLSFPFLGGNPQGYWAPVVRLMGGPDRGAWIPPEVGDEALVAFDQGDVNHPYILGFLHNGAQEPPSNDLHLRMVRSVNGHELAFNDPIVSAGNQGGIRIQDAQGNLIELSNGAITIRSVGSITIQAPNVSINGRPVAIVPSPI